jgi:SAM-dependent methyltransferase
VARESAPYSSSFGSVAAAYAAHRPAYAPAAVRWATARAPGPRVVDLGAGTGKLTAALVRLGLDVTAVEPDARMRAELHRTLPDVRAMDGSAESIPMPDGSCDAVVAGNAMHWFDMDAAAPEIARVLAPAGTLAGLWNVVDDRVEWVAGLARVSGDAAIGPRDTVSNWRAATGRLHLPSDPARTRFGEPEQAEFEHGQRRTADELVATLATRAGMVVMADDERGQRLRAIRDYLTSRPETAHGEFILPLATGVLRLRREA